MTKYTYTRHFQVSQYDLHPWLMACKNFNRFLTIKFDIVINNTIKEFVKTEQIGMINQCDLPAG
jgi:hypothetical protein